MSGEGGEGAGEVVPREWGGERRGGGGSPLIPFNNMAEGPAGAESPFPLTSPLPRCPGTARPFVGGAQQRLRGRGRSAGQTWCGRRRRSGVGQCWVVVRGGRGTRGGSP